MTPPLSVTDFDRALAAPCCACCRAGILVPSRRLFVRLVGAGAAAAALGSARAREGVEVGPPSVFTNAVPAEQIERAAGGQYAQLLAQSRGQGKLASANHPQLKRLRVIASRLIPFTYEWNPRARQWKWEVNLIESPQVNAFCMPGGKIAFFYGILDRLKLVDDEVAMVMGHEMTHALREHSREQLGKTFATRAAIEIGAAVFGLGTGGRLLADMGGQLLTMKFGRTDETEADLVGLELAARSGYDPRAGVTLWQKMAAANQRAPVELLSTHPSGPTRITDIKANLPKVEGLYARAEKPTVRFEPPASPQADREPTR
jgi:Zn-dependent protease with chaperone function